MGINPTPTNHRSFTFDGKSTREFGVYTTGKDVFNSPERAVEMISIPGRDGEYALDQGHFNNIEVTYRAGIVSDSTTDFAEAISNFRNWLASRKGYCRLTDEYNTEEYRMAVFNNAIALEHEGLLTGEFDVTFDCKPQRYLAIGEELIEIGAWGNTETAEGEVVTIEASSDTAVKALTVDIVPVQSGSGTPSPQNIRPISGHDEVGVSVCGVNVWDEEWEVGYIDPNTGQNSTQYSTMIRSKNYVPIKPNTSYFFKSSANASNGMFFYDIGQNLISKEYPAMDSIITAPSEACYLRFCMAVAYGTTYKNDISINYPSTDHEYHAYNGTTYTTTLPSTTYGGTLDVVSGLLTVTHGYIASYNGESLPSTWISDRDVYASGTTPTTGAQVVYELATPTTTTLTGQQIDLLLGENNIFADSGNVTVEYGHNPTILTNPTWFPSKPLLAVEGYGEIRLNNRSIVDIESGQLGDITIANNISASSIQIDGSLFNIGDTVTVSGAYQDITINLRTDGTYYNIVRESESITDSNIDFSTTFLSNSPGAGQQTNTIKYRITVPSFNITIGTDKTITDVVSGTISCKAENPSTNTFTATFTTTREYKYEAATNTITYDAYYSTVSTTAAYVVDAWLTNLKMYFGSVIGHSTVSQLGNPTYIDCDIGEAYMIKDGQPISLNQYIDLGSDLPTLPSGDTEVTYDNTITKVEVKPNWWKV